MLLDQCKGAHCVDLDERFQTHTYLQKVVNIIPQRGLINTHVAELFDDASKKFERGKEWNF